MHNLLICKSVQSTADCAISCLHVDVNILFVHMLITYCLLTIFCKLSVIGHNIYGISLCITDLDVTTFVLCVSSLLSLLVLLGTLSMEGVSYCFNVLSTGSSICQAI